MWEIVHEKMSIGTTNEMETDVQILLSINARSGNWKWARMSEARHTAQVMTAIFTPVMAAAITLFVCVWVWGQKSRLSALTQSGQKK